MKRLQNKISLVTGAAQGIGLSISKLFCKEGAKVIMTDINYQKVKERSHEINQENNNDCSLPKLCS